MNIQRFERNLDGRDFVVGDIHGCFNMLWNALEALGFDERVDRLFSVGDLIDRGPDSIDVIGWLDLPWFHAVMGNHEQMAINFANGHNHAFHYERNGGAWFIKLEDDEQLRIAERLKQLPLAIEIKMANGTYGIIHAEVYKDNWSLLENDYGPIEHCALWNRERIEELRKNEVVGIDRVYVGHTVLDNPVQLGNVHYIDTGAVHSIALTMVDITNDRTYRFVREKKHADQT